MKCSTLILLLLFCTQLRSQNRITLATAITTKATVFEVSYEIERPNNLSFGLGLFYGLHNSLQSSGQGIDFKIIYNFPIFHKFRPFLIANTRISRFNVNKVFDTAKITYFEFTAGYGLEYSIGNKISLFNSLSLGFLIEKFEIESPTSEKNYYLDAAANILIGISYKI